MTPADGGGEDSMLGLAKGLARLEGLVGANFTTVFKRLDRQDQALENLREHKDGELADVRDRLTKLEARRSSPPKKRITAAKWGALAVAIVTILGGIRGAYQAGEEIVQSIHRALIGH